MRLRFWFYLYPSQRGQSRFKILNMNSQSMGIWLRNIWLRKKKYSWMKKLWDSKIKHKKKYRMILRKRDVLKFKCWIRFVHISSLLWLHVDLGTFLYIEDFLLENLWWTALFIIKLSIMWKLILRFKIFWDLNCKLWTAMAKYGP